MLKATTIFLLFALTFTSASIPALSPTPVQQFVVIPKEYDFNVKLWHIKNDIIGLYGYNAFDQGYLKFSPESGEVKIILNDTTASCHSNHLFLDRSYYYSAASTLLFYCANNNSLLTINTNTYTVQDAIPVSSSQIFQEVLLGHNQQGLVYILGLPKLLALPATAPTELILVNLTTKAVESHVIFNKDSDSQLLVTGYAFDSANSYVLTKGLQGGQTLVKINKIVIKENDYQLTPVTNFTYQKEDLVHFTHNPLDIIDGYFFTNDKDNLLIFDPNGNLYLNQTGLETDPRGDSNPGTLWTPTTVARIGGSTFYAYFLGFKAFAFSLQNATMNSTLLDPKIYEMKIALGDTSSEKDLLINLGVDLFFIKEISTNTTIYTSPMQYDGLFYSNTYYFAQGFEVLYVFDRQKSGKLLQTLKIEYAYHDKASNTLMNLVEESLFCRVTYIDLDTLAVTQGPLILNKNACSYSATHINITDRANPFYIIENKNGNYLFVSPKTYGASGTISWTFNYAVWATGTIVPGGDAGKSFTLVYADTKSANKDVQVASYKLNKLLRRFDLQNSYQMASIEMASTAFALYPTVNNKIIMSRFDKQITVLDLNLNTTDTYMVPGHYDLGPGIGTFYDKNKTPYVALSEIVSFGYSTTLPQLFDFTKVTPMPEAIENLSISAVVTGDCSYYVFDEYCNIAVVRFYDTCSAAQTQQISV